MSKVRRNLLVAAGGIVVAYVVLLFVWALRPLDDAVPIGRDAENKPVSQTVECNTLFDGDARDNVPLPTLDSLPPDKTPFEYNRTACTAVQGDARRLFILDTVLAAAAATALVLVALRYRPAPPPPPPPGRPPASDGDGSGGGIAERTPVATA